MERAQLTKIPFEDGIKIADAYVSINDQNYIVIPATYQGTTPLSSLNINQLQTNIENYVKNVENNVESAITSTETNLENSISETEEGLEDKIENSVVIQRANVTLNSTIQANTNYTIPLNYKVNNNSLEVFYCGSKLEKRHRLQRNRQCWRSI